MKDVNGLDSWLETYFEIACAIGGRLSQDDLGAVLSEIQEHSGHCGHQELCLVLTDKFEQQNEGRAWDGEFFDAIDNFLEEELK